jgi:hypothetical protein
MKKDFVHRTTNGYINVAFERQDAEPVLIRLVGSASFTIDQLQAFAGTLDSLACMLRRKELEN